MRENGPPSSRNAALPRQTGSVTGEILAGLLAAVFSDLHLSVSPLQQHQLVTYFSLLLRWSAKINLTSVRTPEEIAWRHFGESLFAAKLIDEPVGLLVDVGSGAGFPGLALKIAWPATKTLLLEPSIKKGIFLKEVIRGCGISGVDVRPERFEEFLGEQPKDAGSATALVTVRGVKISDELLGMINQVLAPSGIAALFLGEADAARISAHSGFTWERPAAIPHSQRRVVLVGRKS